MWERDAEKGRAQTDRRRAEASSKAHRCGDAAASTAVRLLGSEKTDGAGTTEIAEALWPEPTSRISRICASSGGGEVDRVSFGSRVCRPLAPPTDQVRGEQFVSSSLQPARLAASMEKIAAGRGCSGKMRSEGRQLCPAPSTPSAAVAAWARSPPPHADRPSPPPPHAPKKRAARHRWASAL